MLEKFTENYKRLGETEKTRRQLKFKYWIRIVNILLILFCILFSIGSFNKYVSLSEENLIKIQGTITGKHHKSFYDKYILSIRPDNLVDYKSFETSVSKNCYRNHVLGSNIIIQVQRKEVLKEPTSDSHLYLLYLSMGLVSLLVMVVFILGLIKNWNATTKYEYNYFYYYL